MKGYDVLIRNNETGEVRRYHENLEWHEWSLFWWTDGNFGCDCNRYAEFERAGGRPESELMAERWKCGQSKFDVIKAIFPDGSEIEIDGDGVKSSNESSNGKVK